MPRVPVLAVVSYLVDLRHGGHLSGSVLGPSVPLVGRCVRVRTGKPSGVTHAARDATRSTSDSGEGSTSPQSSLTGSIVQTAWLASRPESAAASAHASRGAKVSTHSLIRRSASSLP